MLRRESRHVGPTRRTRRADATGKFGPSVPSVSAVNAAALRPCPKCFPNFFFGLLFLANIFVLVSANAPETLLVFGQVDRRFHTLSSRDHYHNTSTNGSESLKLTWIAIITHPEPGRIKYGRT